MTLVPGMVVAESAPLEQNSYCQAENQCFRVSKQGITEVKKAERVESDLLESDDLDPDLEPYSIPLPSDALDIDYKKGLREKEIFPPE